MVMAEHTTSSSLWSEFVVVVVFVFSALRGFPDLSNFPLLPQKHLI